MDKVNYMEWFQSVGINTGDIIDVASDLLSVMLYCRERNRKFDANELIDALRETVGETGTVLIRIFNWDFCHGKTFDIRRTPSQVGSLGNIALKRKDFRRTQHPLYSWMVWGKFADELCELNTKSSFGDNSIFDVLYKKNAKLLCIGNTNVSGFTQTHYAETIANVPYRFEKNFKSEYIDLDGKKSIKEYSMFVRYLDYKIEADVFQEVYEEWIKLGIIQKKEIDWLHIAQTDIKRGVDFFVNDLINNMGRKMCRINGIAGYQYAIDCPPHIKNDDYLEE